MKKYTSLTIDEIQLLENQGCKSDSWQTVYKSLQTDLDKIKNVTFSGNVYVGAINGTRAFYGGILVPNKIHNVHLHNVTIGDNCYINNVKNYISNYQIGDNVVIENVDVLVVGKETTFGNGIMIDAINEGGGRSIPIFDKLTAQTAYLLSLYRHKTELIKLLKEMIDGYVLSITNSVGKIGNNVQIINTKTIKEVNIGDNAVIDSAHKLINGSINSTQNSPVFIGSGVMAHNFIISSDTKIDNSSLISNCFVGQGCVIDKHYSAEHSVFFANCQGYNGEACSIFAGPYTVTHHKSTLLIAGMFSFMNAGSGSNQSNHMYKLGPIHQGIMERGAKTTSDSYVLWPSKIGAFTLVMGRHYHNVDSSEFPFSYLIESGNKSYLVPGANLKSVGTVRDVQKWPKRDNRHQEDRLDVINFNLLSPFTIHNVFLGYKKLHEILENAGNYFQEYTYHGMTLKKNSINTGIELYNSVIIKFLGNSLISRIEKNTFNSITELKNILKPTSIIGKGKWIDIGGLICPVNALDIFIESIEHKKIDSIEDVNIGLQQIHQNYYEYEWNWAVELFETYFDIKIENLTKEDIVSVIRKWKTAVVGLDELLFKDAKKEFSLKTQVGFGVDGDEKERNDDFINVRGEFESNSTVLEIKNHIERKEALGDQIILKIKELNS